MTAKAKKNAKGTATSATRPSKTTPTLTINPELKNLLPPLSAEEFAGLEADVLKNGCLSDLIKWNETLVDGHHRYEICTKRRISFGVKNIHFETLDDAKLWICKHQANRRNLTPFHRAELALKLKKVIAAKAKVRQQASGGDRKSEQAKSVLANRPEPIEPKTTRQELAEIAGVGSRTLAKVEFIAEHADEATKEKLRRGEKGTSIDKEYNRLKTEKKAAAEPDPKPVAEPGVGNASPESPCPAKIIKHFSKATLENVTQELLRNLFANFHKGAVDELVFMAMKKINENLGQTAILEIFDVLDERYGISNAAEFSQESEIASESIGQPGEPQVTVSSSMNLPHDYPELLAYYLTSRFPREYARQCPLLILEALCTKDGPEAIQPLVQAIIEKFGDQQL